MKFIFFCYFFLFVAMCADCIGANMMKYSTISDVPDSVWEKLAAQKIFFGHQSVGDNIIDGIRDVMKDNPIIKLNMTESFSPSSFVSPIFAHSIIGKNTDPKSKIDAFANIINNGVGVNVNIAFMKLCFADVTDNTDINIVFDEYKNNFSFLKEKYKNVTFVHITVPLTVVQSGIKSFIKKIINKPIDGYAKNLQRELINEKFRKFYEGREPLFDLAKIESTFPDDRRSSFRKDGRMYYSLVTEYTYDGGHLNEKGRKLVAEQLLVFLANIAE